jgi:hypothetical protein
MADTESGMGRGGTLVRRPAVEPVSKITLLRQGLSAVNLVTTIGA